MGAIATFNYSAWVVAYPEFTGVGQPRAQTFWDQATLYWRNDGSGPAKTVEQQTVLLNLLTAHIAALNSNADGSPSPANNPVGHMSQAAEGSVSASFELGTDVSVGMAWYTQTKYGLSFWQATAGFRMARYRRYGTGAAGGGLLPRFR